MKVIAFVGISGVGKSNFLKSAKGAAPFVHLEASNLIKEELALVQRKLQTSEELRTGPVLDNQKILIKAFERQTRAQEGLIVLDGHTVVDTGSELQRIPASIFAEIGVEAIIFLQDVPEIIRARRQADANRPRPDRTTHEIEHHQQEALLAAADIARDLSVPLHVVTHSLADKLFELIQNRD